MECTDNNCSTHGHNLTRGRSFEGTVIAAAALRTATVEWMWRRYNAKFERYNVQRSRVKAHNPPCINAKPGDKVMIHECRPLSKTKHFVVTQKIGTAMELLIKGEKEKKYEGKGIRKEPEDGKKEVKKSLPKTTHAPKVEENP